MNAITRVTVLLSGGLDSAACVGYYRDRGYPISAVFIDYGQPVVRRERESARKIALWYGIDLIEVDCCSGGVALPMGEIPGRNGFLVFAAMTLAGVTRGLLALGIHNGTGYYDCSPHFLDSVNRLVSGYADGRLTIVAPFLNWDKNAVRRLADLINLSTDLTWSCEVGPSEPCGKCRSCIDVETLRACP